MILNKNITFDGNVSDWDHLLLHVFDHVLYDVCSPLCSFCLEGIKVNGS